MRHQHARRRDLDHGDVALARERHDGTVVHRRLGGDERARRVRPAAVEDADRDVGRDRGKDRARVEHLGAEVGELGRLAERQVRDDARVAHHAGIGGEHAVDVGPDLDLGHAEARADDGRGVVRAAAPERRRHAVARGADVPADDRHEPGREVRRHLPLQGVAGLGGQWRGSRVLVVGDDRLARVDPRRIDAGGLKRARHDAAAEQLARRRDAVAGARRGLAQDRERRQHRAQLVDLLLDRRDRPRSGRAGAPAPRPRPGGAAGSRRPRSRSSRARRARRRPSSAGADRSPSTWRTRPPPAAHRMRAACAETIAISRRMASASATDVPPNFITTFFIDCAVLSVQ